VVLHLIYAFCMVATMEMTTRMISAFPWSQPNAEGLHLISIPYLFGPVSLLAIVVAGGLGLRNALSLTMVSISALFIFLMKTESLIPWLVLSTLGISVCLYSLFTTWKHGADKSRIT